jgi:hypothetical protein
MGRTAIAASIEIANEQTDRVRVGRRDVVSSEIVVRLEGKQDVMPEEQIAAAPPASDLVRKGAPGKYGGNRIFCGACVIEGSLCGENHGGYADRMPFEN